MPRRKQPDPEGEYVPDDDAEVHREPGERFAALPVVGEVPDDCKHPPMRVHKGFCHACGRPVK